MTATVIALSGRVCAGKTTLARHLVADPGGRHISTRAVLRRYLDASFTSTEREALQELGRRLDNETAGHWITDAVLPVAQSAHDLVIVDAVRVSEQLDDLSESLAVVHVHLTAPIDVLAARYERMRRRRPQNREPAVYACIATDPTEARVETLAARADVVIDTAANTIEATRAAAVTFIAKLSG